ncbi:MAG: AAA family ATPase [Bacteroidales bacterium]|nr:AAA family ATPase [Bacteroidales bacterium]
MKLRAFRIRNYRSIVDTGWCYLAFDDITALIGQNESGKTSVLEALKCFYERRIMDDVLRSDLSYPIIECTFEMENERFSDFLNRENLPDELYIALADKKEFSLSCEWTDSKTYKLNISEPSIVKYFETMERSKEEEENKIGKAIEDLYAATNMVIREMEIADKAKHDARKALNEMAPKLEETRKAAHKNKKPDLQIMAKQEFEKISALFEEKEKDFNDKLQVFEAKKMLTQEISEKVSVCKTYTELSEHTKQLDDQIEKKYAQLLDTEHYHDLCSHEKERRSSAQRLDQLRSEYQQMQKSSKEYHEQLLLKKKIASLVLDGKKFHDAEVDATIEIENSKHFLSQEDIAETMFNNIPVFEFFEDFSSLLPNKIDLEDLLNESGTVEGYKAAQNFLKVAGLNADFFREKNQRILKQKIENLNTDITIDFQDYWSQNIGKDNKIRLNFELEHYDYTVPEKSGKPYLEFWIKDNTERLYPKQRSRGVRWFLSFYLELKATARKNHFNRVLLIDEPGLSLHARAQEDVLKVFEDLRNKMQIIYCTHSPHLVDASKLYRIMAVQRADEEDERSETVVMDAKSLHEASSDTLTPIYSLMGARLYDQQLIQQKNNIIVEDAVTYYYLTEMARLSNFQGKAFFIPSNNESSIPVLVNILIGWKLDFMALIFDTSEKREIAEWLRKSSFLSSEVHAGSYVMIAEGFPKVEDLFSTIDFKRFILQKRIGITESNSDYIENNSLSRMILVTNFLHYIQHEKIGIPDFDEETRKNFKQLFERIKKSLN